MKAHILERNEDGLLSQNDLKALGLDEVCYIKKYNIRGKSAWVVHAADGVAIGVQDNAEAARFAAEHKELDIVTVH